MRNVTRTDGSVYVASSRATFSAMGWFQPEQRPAASAVLLGFCGALKAGATLADMVAGLPREARQAGAIAGALVRAFTVVTGVPAYPAVEQGVQVTGRDDCTGLFVDRVFPEEYSDIADRVSRSLAELLAALGAEHIVACNVD
jgi:hypothetical protein